MNDIILSLYNGSVLTISILIFLLGVVAVKSSRSATARATIIAFTALAYAALFVGPVQLLSYAKPVSMEWLNRDVPEAEVLHAELREGDGIYLLLDWYGVPRYYKIPWDPILAQQLLEAMEQAREEAGGGDRPGAQTPTEGEQGQGQEQGLLDQLLGPMSDSDESGDMGEPGEEGDEGQGQTGAPGTGTGTMGAMGMAMPGPQGDQQGGRGDMTNAGNGRVMMRNPFKERSVGEQDEGEGEEGRGGDLPEGEGPSARYNDELTEAMFYPMPQPRYPEKFVPEG